MSVNPKSINISDVKNLTFSIAKTKIKISLFNNASKSILIPWGSNF
jgi:hypothetical protein